MIDLKNISKSFGAICALENINLRVETGRSLALIGPTMAGKSVLLKCLTGLYAPTSGDIFIDGETATDPAMRDKALSNRIGMLFQHNALFDSLPIWENISFRLIATGVSRKAARARAEELLPRVGLPVETANLFPADLSGGMQKRVGFARAIAAQADILLLDNPTAGLDPILAARIEGMISTIVQETGATIISVVTDMNHVTENYDDIAVLHAGKLRWHGTAQAAQRSENGWVKQLLAGSREGPIKTVSMAR